MLLFGETILHVLRLLTLASVVAVVFALAVWPEGPQTLAEPIKTASPPTQPTETTSAATPNPRRGKLDPVALRHYHDRLVALQTEGIGLRGSLSELLQPLFVDAESRSRHGDPVLENAALLSLLGTWSRGKPLDGLVPGDIERPQRFLMKLHRRRDFAQHFLFSAALAARGDSALSNAVGLFKEIMDTEHGTGFSFTDIAANVAGSRFGELAVSERAATLQQALADGVTDGDLLPVIDDLPEFMDTAAFEAQFGRVGSPSYEAMMSDIHGRIMALPLYQEP